MAAVKAVHCCLHCLVMQLKHFLRHLGAHHFSPESIEMALNIVSFYADDLSLCVSMSIGEILDILKSFGSFSGYKLNINNSECFCSLLSWPLPVFRI